MSTNLQVLELHNSSNFNRIAQRIEDYNIARLGSEVVILGCAGFSGMQYKLTNMLGGKITFVDPIVLGFQTLVTNATFLATERRRCE